MGSPKRHPRLPGERALAGKRVLDVGAASGFLTFYMESQGAEVVSYDLAPEHPWDIVPYARNDLSAYIAERREIIRRLNNGYWFCHKAFASKARMAHGTVYTIPARIGGVDIAVCGSILPRSSRRWPTIGAGGPTALQAAARASGAPG